MGGNEASAWAASCAGCGFFGIFDHPRASLKPCPAAAGQGTVDPMDFKTIKIPQHNQARAMIVSLARKHLPVRPEEPDSVLKMRFSPPVLDALLNLSASLP